MCHRRPCTGVVAGAGHQVHLYPCVLVDVDLTDGKEPGQTWSCHTWEDTWPSRASSGILFTTLARIHFKRLAVRRSIHIKSRTTSSKHALKFINRKRWKTSRWTVLSLTTVVECDTVKCQYFICHNACQWLKACDYDCISFGLR